MSPLDHQVQQLQEAAAVVLGPAGLLGSNIAHGAAGADQPLHLQVQILVLRLSDRDPGIAIQRHLSTPLAGIPEVWLSAKGFATGFASHPFSYGKWGVCSHGCKQGCFQPPRPGESDQGWCSGLGDRVAGPMVQQHNGSKVHSRLVVRNL